MLDELSILKYEKIIQYVSSFKLKTVRFLMGYLRNNPEVDVFFPELGITSGEFVTYYVYKKILLGKR